MAARDQACLLLRRVQGFSNPSESTSTGQIRFLLAHASFPPLPLVESSLSSVGVSGSHLFRHLFLLSATELGPRSRWPRLPGSPVPPLRSEVPCFSGPDAFSPSLSCLKHGPSLITLSANGAVLLLPKIRSLCTWCELGVVRFLPFNRFLFAYSIVSMRYAHVPGPALHYPEVSPPAHRPLPRSSE